MKNQVKTLVSAVAILVSTLAYGQLFEGETGIYQNNKLVGEGYVPKWTSPTEYNEYYVLAHDYSYLEKATWDKHLKPNYFADKETFRKAMIKKYPNGKWIAMHCKEEAL